MQTWPGPSTGSIQPPTPDPRLLATGTLLQKRDRHGAVRCECTVEEVGIRYAGKVYRLLSSAAMAAAKNLGLNNKTQNGFTFWGLSKPPRAQRDPLAALERAWERYHGNVTALVRGASPTRTARRCSPRSRSTRRRSRACARRSLDGRLVVIAGESL
jgi:hypothetical protein